MKSIRVDVENKTVRAEPGCLLRDLDAELSVHGLVVPGGTTVTTAHHDYYCAALTNSYE